MARPLSNRVLVEHTSGARKYVLRTQLGQLSPLWARVSERRSRKAAVESTTGPADQPTPDEGKE